VCVHTGGHTRPILDQSKLSIYDANGKPLDVVHLRTGLFEGKPWVALDEAPDHGSYEEHLAAKAQRKAEFAAKRAATPTTPAVAATAAPAGI